MSSENPKLLVQKWTDQLRNFVDPPAAVTKLVSDVKSVVGQWKKVSLKQYTYQQFIKEVDARNAATFCRLSVVLMESDAENRGLFYFPLLINRIVALSREVSFERSNFFPD